jgi:outer membrane protein TolC
MMNRVAKLIVPWSIAGVSLLRPTSSLADVMTLDEFLNQIKSTHQGLKSSTLAAEAAAERSVEGEMVYAPTVFATLQTAVDKKEQPSPAQSRDSASVTSVQAGVQKVTDFGLTSKVYYGVSQTKISGANPNILPDSEYSDASPTVELSQSLWKNRGGRDVKASVELQKIQSEVTYSTESFKRLLTVVESETIYWRLAIARDSIAIAKDNLARADKIVSWSKRQVSSQLADEADLIQVESLREVRSLELQAAYDEEKAAAASFNTARGVTGSDVREELTKITPQVMSQMPKPKRQDTRFDVQAAEKATLLAERSADLAGEKYTPTLDLFGAFTLNGQDKETSSAFSESFKTDHPTWAVGIRFSAPLASETLSQLRGAYAKEHQAASLSAQRKRYEADREWDDLERKLNEAIRRLELVQKIESSQKRKLESERSRLNRGRSTTFQVLSYESDLAGAQLNLLKTKADIINIMARMKAFGGAA